MSVWDTYENRISSGGGSKYGAAYEREKRLIETKAGDNLSYGVVDIYPSEFGYNIESDVAQSHKISQSVTIIDSDNLNEKTMLSIPGEEISLGSLVVIEDSYWLVEEKSFRSVLYTKSKLIQCNHLLRWIDNGEFMTQWCVIEDGTKYLTGELEDRHFIVTRGDSRIAMIIARNAVTVKFNRETRFLIDDPDSPHKLSYILTKPLKLGLTYNDTGVFKFVLQEVTATGDDNHELGIADYYKYFNSDGTRIASDTSTSGGEDSDTPDPNRKKVWL